MISNIRFVMAKLLKITPQRYYKIMKLPSLFPQKCVFSAKKSIFSIKSTVFVWLIQKKALPLPRIRDRCVER